jgi:ribulose-phosphate 3-epimerase
VAHLHRVVHQIKERGILAGVSLNPATPLSLVEEILPDLDLLLLMTVNPGFGGQSFIESMPAKIAKARRLLDERAFSCLIEVDGGVTEKNVSLIAGAGADIIVAGAAVFGSPNYAESIGNLKKRVCGNNLTC